MNRGRVLEWYGDYCWHPTMDNVFLRTASVRLSPAPSQITNRVGVPKWVEVIARLLVQANEGLDALSEDAGG